MYNSEKQVALQTNSWQNCVITRDVFHVGFSKRKKETKGRNGKVNFHMFEPILGKISPFFLLFFNEKLQQDYVLFSFTLLSNYASVKILVYKILRPFKAKFRTLITKFRIAQSRNQVGERGALRPS